MSWPLDVSGVSGALEIAFDSSWRPEYDSNYHQTANITVSFDGGEPVEVMLWESNSDGRTSTTTTPTKVSLSACRILQEPRAW